MDRPRTSPRDRRVNLTVSNGNMHSAEATRELTYLAAIISNIMEPQT